MKRRSFLTAGVAGAVLAASGATGAQTRLRPNASDNQSAALAQALAEASAGDMPLVLAPGTYRIGGVDMPAGARIEGTAGATRLLAAKPGPIFRGQAGSRLRLAGLIFDGANLPFGEGTGLVELGGIEEAVIADCHFVDAPARGVGLERCGGRIESCRFEGLDTAVYSNDSAGLSILGNVVRGCANNGILVHQSRKARDGSIVARNRIEAIGAKGGGLGWYGNGINVFRAGNVVVSENIIRDCAFSFIRANSGDAVQILGNNCDGAGETGIYCEFSFEGAMIAHNSVTRAATGIAVVNFDKGGRLATVVGNVVRGAFRRPLLDRAGDGYGVGIAAEADASVTGNVLEDCQRAGIALGYGNFLRDVAVTGNVVRGGAAAIIVTVAESERNVLISGNVFAQSSEGSVIGYRWEAKATADLAADGAEQIKGITIGANQVR